jgi:hypothetical protein
MLEPRKTNIKVMASLIRALSWPLIPTTIPTETNDKKCNGTHNVANGKKVNVKHAPTFQQLIAARRLICRRYYPEGSFGWIILFVGLVVNVLTHGLQLCAIFLLMPASKRFKVDEVDCFGKWYFKVITNLVNYDTHIKENEKSLKSSNQYVKTKLRAFFLSSLNST